MRGLLAIFLFTTWVANAQVVENFELTNVVDGKTIALNDFTSSKAVIIIFSAHACPYNEYYLTRIKNLSETNKNKIPVIVINSSSESDESAEKMAAYATQNNLQFPYLADKEQKALAIFKPRKNPECYLLQNSSGKFSIVYKGAIDDNPQSPTDVHHSYLQSAIDQLLSGKKIEHADVRPVGCSIIKN